MKKTSLLAASIALSLAPLVKAELTLPPQPITLLSNYVGSDQTDFFHSDYFSDDYVTFSSIFPVTVRGVQKEYRLFYDVKMAGFTRAGAHNFYSAADRFSPLIRTGVFLTNANTKLDFWQQTSGINNTQRAFFRIPGYGYYQSTRGSGPLLVYPENATYPITGAALRFPENEVNDSDRTEQFRVTLGGYYPRLRGFEPFISGGTISYTSVIGGTSPSLQPVTGAHPVAGTGSEYPSNFTNAFNAETYFVALDSNKNPAIFHTAVSNRGVFSAVPVVTGFTESDKPLVLTGFESGLFYNYQNALYWTPGVGTQTSAALYNSNFNSAPIIYANQLTPQLRAEVNQVAHSVAMSAYDTTTLSYRLTIFDTGGGGSGYYSEFSNQAAGYSSYPAKITPTGSYFYYTGYLNGGNSGPYMMRAFDGSQSGAQFVDAVVDGAHITEVGEVVCVSDNSSGGVVYFTGTATINGVLEAGILFAIGTERTDGTGKALATPLKTANNHYVHDAHNLRAVTGGGDIFRLYFSAPVPANEAADGKAHGNLPWVTNVE